MSSVPKNDERPYTVGPVQPFLGALRVHEFRLANGLKLYVVPDHEAPVVAWQTWYGVGSADEITGKTGLAHLFEHLMFKGSRAYADGEYMAKLEALGVEGLNAWTWLDQTVYVQAVPKEHVEEVARLESIRMNQLLVEHGPFASELEVVMNERRLSVDNNPDGKLSELLFKTAYGAHPYGVPTIGWMADLENMKVEDAQAFYRQYYAPDNATIIVVGDVVPDAIADLVARSYGSLPASRPERPKRPVEPLQMGQRRDELKLPISGDRVLVGFKVPGYADADIPALLVLDAALSAGQSGRLQRALRDRGYVADLGASVVPLRDPTLYEIVLQGRPGVPAEVAEEAFWAEIARIRDEGISDGELHMGISQWEAHTWGQLEDALGKANLIGWSLTHTGDLRDGLRRIEAIRHTTREDVQRVARAWLVPERATVVVGRAEQPAPRVDVAKQPPVEPARRVEVPSREPAPAPEGAGLSRKTIRGATVLLEHDDTLPIVHFRLFLPSGSAADPAGREGLAWLASKLLLRGTTKRSRREFEEALEQLGASLAASADPDGVWLSGSSLASTWPAFVSLVGEALAHPAYDPGELAQLVRETEDELAAIPDDDGELAAIALRRRLYGPTHPYGRDTRGTAASLRTITSDDLRGFHQRFLRAGGAVVGVAGAYDAAIEADLDAVLGGIDGQPAALPPAPAPTWPPKRAVVLVDKPDRTQATVMIGQLGVRGTDPDFADLVLANDAFGVGFGGRLFKKVRMENGWSYFAYSYPMIRRGEGAFVMGIAPANDQAADAIALVLRMCEEADRDGFTSEEIEQVRAGRLNGRPFLVDTTRKRIDLALRKETSGYDRLAATERMASTTREEASAAFARVLEPSRLVVAVTGTAELVRARLEAALGPVEVISFRDVAGTAG